MQMRTDVKKTALALAILLSCPAFAQDIYSNPSVVGIALPGQIPGTATNDNAASGKVGEYVSANVAQGSAVPLTTGVPSNVTSISLTAGDYDVAGIVCLSGGATTVLQVLIAAVNITSATLPTSGMTNRSQLSYGASGTTPFAGSGIDCQPLAISRISISGATTAYLIGYSDFTTSTVAAFGQIVARRVR